MSNIYLYIYPDATVLVAYDIDSLKARVQGLKSNLLIKNVISKYYNFYLFEY